MIRQNSSERCLTQRLSLAAGELDSMRRLRNLWEEGYRTANYKTGL
jgi:hypothetical protein